MVHGKVFLVGAGPGNPKLLTIRAAELLKTAKNVVYDRLVSEEILELIPEMAERVYVGKESGRHVVPQDKITELLVKMALEGKEVVRLKGGDPFIFGRGGEEAEALAENNINFEIVPGVSSSIAAPTYAGIPLTHRDFASSVAIVTGHQAGDGERTIDWAKIANSVDTIVILMGIESLEAIISKLVIGNINSNTPVALIEKGTSKHQRTIIGTIGSIVKDAQKAEIKPPAVVVIGGVVNLGRKLSWFKPTHH